MQLRTIVGAHAGEVREYAYLAGRAALEAGTAEPVTRVEPTPTPTSMKASVVEPIRHQKNRR